MNRPKFDLMATLLDIARTPTERYWIRDDLDDVDPWWQQQDSDEQYQREQLERMKK